jgi:hypothetical protein
MILIKSDSEDRQSKWARFLPLSVLSSRPTARILMLRPHSLHTYSRLSQSLADPGRLSKIIGRTLLRSQPASWPSCIFFFTFAYSAAAIPRRPGARRCAHD